MSDEALILHSPAKLIQRVEIARSFAYKLNCETHGGLKYEARDFFCSQKAECDADDASDVSEALYQFCRGEVLKAVREYISEMKRRKVE